MNTSADDMTEPNRAYAAVFGSVLALGLPLNAVSLGILLRNQSLRSTTTVLMVNLALSDLLLVTSLPTRVYYYAAGAWPLGRTACVLVVTFFNINIRSGSVVITFISVDRLLALVYPLRSRHLRTASNAWRCAAINWLFWIAMSVPTGLNLSRKLQGHNESTCFLQASATQQNSYEVAMLCVLSAFMGFLLVVNIVCTVLVSCSLRRNLSDSAGINNKVKVLIIYALNLVMFVIFFLPVMVAYLYKVSDIVPWICLACMNCLLDPLLYYFSFDAFWKKNRDVTLAMDNTRR